MITSCTHCDAQYELPDKMLGKRGRCKKCNKLFVIVPDEGEVSLDDFAPPQRGGSTAQLAPVRGHEQSIGDPLDALADAAVDSTSGMAPAPRITRMNEPSVFDGEQTGKPKRMAKGASTAMGVGITACVLGAAGMACGIVGMVNADNKSLLTTMGLIAIGLLALTAALGMVAVINGTSASSKIRKARHPLGGRSQASTGSITGAIALGIVLIGIVTGAIWLSNRGGIVFEKEITADEAKPD